MPWRTWDPKGMYYKPDIENTGLNLLQLQGRVDINLQALSYLEPRYAQLIRDIPPYNSLNSEMIYFCT